TGTATAADSLCSPHDARPMLTVEDHTPPTITCAGNKTVECASAWSFDAPSATDTCGNVTITILGTVTNITGHCGNTLDATRTWRSADHTGETPARSEQVTVLE